MFWIIALLVLILVVLIFGPLVAGIFAMLVAIAGSVFLAALLLVGCILVLIYFLGGVGWVVWWCFDRRGAMAALREARAARQRR